MGHVKRVGAVYDLAVQGLRLIGLARPASGVSMYGLPCFRVYRVQGLGFRVQSSMLLLEL